MTADDKLMADAEETIAKMDRSMDDILAAWYNTAKETLNREIPEDLVKELGVNIISGKEKALRNQFLDQLHVLIKEFMDKDDSGIHKMGAQQYLITLAIQLLGVQFASIRKRYSPIVVMEALMPIQELFEKTLAIFLIEFGYYTKDGELIERQPETIQ